MRIVTNLAAWQTLRKKITSASSIGFVPTMGHLHAGHLHLCQRSCAENNITIVSIFVNPTQFNQTSDFENYPKTIERDKELLASYPIDYLLLPESAALYPDRYQLQITENTLSTELEGKYRPGHFNGMLTVVLKLLNLVSASRAYFGEKDYQQLLLIKKMAAALFLPTDIVACETVRDQDGVALSSRHTRLNSEQRKKAVIFAHLLKNNASVEEIKKQLEAHGLKVDYIAEQWQRRLGAVWIEDVRLIDNISIL